MVLKQACTATCLILAARRKLGQSVDLITVASKVLAFRKEEFKIQTDRRHAGLSLEADLLTAQASLSKAESDYYAAYLNYRMSLTDLKILTGPY